MKNNSSFTEILPFLCPDPSEELTYTVAYEMPFLSELKGRATPWSIDHRMGALFAGIENNIHLLVHHLHTLGSPGTLARSSHLLKGIFGSEQ